MVLPAPQSLHKDLFDKEILKVISTAGKELIKEIKAFEDDIEEGDILPVQSGRLNCNEVIFAIQPDLSDSTESEYKKTLSDLLNKVFDHMINKNHDSIAIGSFTNANLGINYKDNYETLHSVIMDIITQNPDTFKTKKIYIYTNKQKEFNKLMQFDWKINELEERNLKKKHGKREDLNLCGKCRDQIQECKHKEDEHSGICHKCNKRKMKDENKRMLKVREEY
mmetsp:Transcript_20239/g.17915  ORF Transcript_20239/g.17915 Transcript_20239/m.17915 type:complete len:223 (+) Transcript_20239:298-966(+)